MESFTGITASDILNEREQARADGRLAHTLNTRGEGMFWVHCNCYTCRDHYDPTGEEDAARRNCPIPPPPPSPPVLRRQNALCLECGVGHTCSDPCQTSNVSLGRTASGPFTLRLPPPPPAIRMPRLSSMSPIVGGITPRSLSEPMPIDEEVTKEEKSLIRRLGRMLETYTRLEIYLQSEEVSSRSHDEMMMFQMAWEDMDRKRSAVEELLRVLKH